MNAVQGLHIHKDRDARRAADAADSHELVEIEFEVIGRADEIVENLTCATSCTVEMG
jgi:hypothetical protein